MMNMFKPFINIDLTADQQSALKAIEDFLLGDRHIFILKGYAGTGKTTLIRIIGEYLNKERKLGAIMAPTGRAAKVLKDKTGLPASTIHKAIYNFKDLVREKDEFPEENRSFRYYFTLTPNQTSPGCVFLVDEASMVADHFTEGEFFRFGSGRLLSDILSFVDLHTTKAHKIIFVGDPAQLPPVSENMSWALEEGYFQDKGLAAESFEMKEVVRQEAESGILANATKIRHHLEKDTHDEYEMDLGYPDTREISVSDLVAEYTSGMADPGLGKAAVIGYSNNVVLEYNRLIRESLFPGQQEVVAGDLLMVTYNNYTGEVELLNGEIVKVLDASEAVETLGAPVMVEGKKKNISITFRDVELFVPGAEKTVKCKIINNYLYSGHRDLSPYETKALYINFVMRFKSKRGNQHKEDSDVFKKELRTDPYFNAVRAKFGYAITCHKAQGGEWENVFVDFYDRIGLSDTHFRWGYTAITRASKRLFVVNPPKIEPFSALKLSRITRIGRASDNMYAFIDIPETRFHTAGTHPAKRLKFFEVEDKLENTPFEIDKVITSGYQEQYYFRLGNRVIRVDAYHNEAGIFTRYSVQERSPEAEALLEIMKTPYPWETNWRYRPGDESLLKLFQYVSSCSEAAGSRILNVDESTLPQFYINYFFSTRAECAYIQFYMNRQGQVTHALPKSTLGEEDEILASLCVQLSKA
jgi:hypothetical protein